MRWTKMLINYKNRDKILGCGYKLIIKKGNFKNLLIK